MSFPFSSRKRIIAIENIASFSRQQPDSTVTVEPSVKNQTYACDTPSTTPVPKKPIPFNRSSIVSMDRDDAIFDDSDCYINTFQSPCIPEQRSVPAKAKFSEGNRGTFGNQSISDSLIDSPFNQSPYVPKNKNAHMDSSDLFFSPKRPDVKRCSLPEQVS